MPLGSKYNQTLINCVHRAIMYGCNEAVMVLYKKVDPVFPCRTSDSIIVSQITQGLVSKMVFQPVSIVSAFVVPKFLHGLWIQEVWTCFHIEVTEEKYKNAFVRTVQLWIETSCTYPKVLRLVGPLLKLCKRTKINSIKPILRWNRQKEVLIEYKQFNFSPQKQFWRRSKKWKRCMAMRWISMIWQE